MKKVLFILTLSLTMTSIAQTFNAVELEKKKLRQALVYGDQEVATMTMYNIIALEGDTSVYKDSLAYIYFNRRDYLSSYLAVTDALKNNPDNIEMLEISAFSLESLGAKDRAAEVYKELLAKSQNNYHAYKVAVLEFEIQKLDEAYASIKKADQLPDAGTNLVAFTINQNYNQNVPLKASISYIEGLIAIELDKKTEAKASFTKAIGLFPEFILAKEKLGNLNEDTTPKE